ncbi:MAG TPA: SxtJ family membrane protein [Pyrinomonadaceae bacterium]|nr:SxtJ family membrane protein [Pyrinomonadaceae bacterium]
MNLTALPFFQHVKWRPDNLELRRFAISMLVGFSLLGLFAFWRAGEVSTGSLLLWGIGLLLAIAALVPRLGRLAYLGVYLPTSIVGYFVSQVILVLMFFLIITPLGIILRLMGKDPLQQRQRKPKTRWTRVEGVKSEDNYYRQF